MLAIAHDIFSVMPEGGGARGRENRSVSLDPCMDIGNSAGCPLKLQVGYPIRTSPNGWLANSDLAY